MMRSSTFVLPSHQEEGESSTVQSSKYVRLPTRKTCFCLELLLRLAWEWRVPLPLFSITVRTSLFQNFLKCISLRIKIRFLKSRLKRYYRHFGESRKKVNLSESGSRDWVDQIVWNFDTSKINILIQCVPNFVHIGPPDHMKRTVFQRVVSKCYYRPLWRKSEKGQSFGKWFSTGIDCTKSSEILGMEWTKYQCLKSMCTKFRLDWSRIIQKDTFIKESFQSAVIKALAKDGILRSIFRESDSRDLVDQVVWNFNTF